jgi:hypothetical protein
MIMDSHSLRIIMHVHAAGGDVAGLRVAARYDALSSPMIDRNAQRGPERGNRLSSQFGHATC